MQLLPAFVGAPERNKVYNLDWRTLVSALPDQSVDAYLTDLPYGTTACTWDEIIPFAPMWAEVKRTLKPRGVFVTTASQPFTSKLVCSNLEWFHEELIWHKTKSTGFLDANRKHLKQHEDLIVFCEGLPTYNPQMAKGEIHRRGRLRQVNISQIYNDYKDGLTVSDEYYPGSIVFTNSIDTGLQQHPTQKPVALYEYLINTYTQPGELVVDFCAGSGTTAVAARNTGREWIIGDSSEHYCNVARERLRTSILEPHYVQRESDVSKLPLFAMAANA